jgi:hypothetical protein
MDVSNQDIDHDEDGQGDLQSSENLAAILKEVMVGGVRGYADDDQEESLRPVAWVELHLQHTR